MVPKLSVWPHRLKPGFLERGWWHGARPILVRRPTDSRLARGWPLTHRRSVVIHCRSMARQKQTAFRLSDELLARLDRYAEQLEREQPGLEINRTDALRIILTRYLDAVDAEKKKRK